MIGFCWRQLTWQCKSHVLLFESIGESSSGLVMAGMKAAVTHVRSTARRVWRSAGLHENAGVHAAVRGKEDGEELRRSRRHKERSASRPSIDDVTRISRGQRAKKRGTGSRMVCHRLNAEERRTYERATLPQHPPKNRVLVLHNGSNRRERKGSPLWNIYRLWCDSNAFPAVVCDLVRSLWSTSSHAHRCEMPQTSRT